MVSLFRILTPMFNKNTKPVIRSLDGNIGFFVIIIGVLQGNILASFLLIIFVYFVPQI